MTQQQMDEMNKRGDKAMGFDHLKTTHHFLLATNGLGGVRVTSKTITLNLIDTFAPEDLYGRLNSPKSLKLA